MKKQFLTLLLMIFGVIFQGQSQDVSELFRKVNPSVVVIMTQEKSLTNLGGMGRAMVASQGLGSGVLISKEGEILTASHVVNTAEKISVKFLDGEEIPASIVSVDKQADVALIKLNWPKKNGVVAKLGESNNVKTGERVIVIGSPLGLEHSLSVGNISAKHIKTARSHGFIQSEFFQTDAAINHGNSGGPMFNLNGEVIGIVSYILSQSGGFEGLGFAATTNIAKKLVIDRRPFWTGLESVPLNGELAKIFNLPQEMGLLVQKVVPLSPTDIMGLKGGVYEAEIEGEKLLLGGDIILSVDKFNISPQLNEEELLDHFAQLKSGDTFSVKVLRKGEIITLKGLVP
ncbi:S1C family serine protease [Flexithrix dorotheae]|uniref:S1C family serine protease n=1 Tax=Flexithrix dorotheae TaxID=70993 RepID=UPI0003787169|nr:trypsin-like peptidase domain-containing protein [Flexithrix dorotheae]